MVARGPNGERSLPGQVVLTPEGGMPADRWASQDRYGPEYQLATIRADIARLVANGQPLELHGDNLYLHLDLSERNLPAGSLLRLGDALLRVTHQAHNGCKKWVQRFGLDAMQLNLAPAYRQLHLRGIYLEVIEAGRVHLGDPVVVELRPT
jgi:MOSC domain-containing protein YiiM